jgi:predicted RNA-binding protein with EMAP domain
MDTAKDARVLVLEDALKRLNEITTNRRVRVHLDYSKLTESLKTAGALLYEVKYSYVEPKALADLDATKKLVAAIGEVGQVYDSAIKSTSYKPKTVKEIEAVSELSYALRIVQGLQRRFRECGDDAAFATDILAVQVSEAHPLETSKNLTECRCSDGSRVWHIITNIKGLKPGTKLACAVLPPAEMMGAVSEAMFLGEEALPDSTKLGPMLAVSPSALDQARAHVMNILKRMV